MRALAFVVVCTSLAAVASTASARSAADPGTRANPFPLHVRGEVRGSRAWTLRVNDLVENANEIAKRYSTVNPSPSPGSQFVMVNLTARNGSSRTSSTFNAVSLFFVGARRTYDLYFDRCGVVPSGITYSAPLRRGRALMGNLCSDVRVGDVSKLLLVAEPAQLPPGTSRTFFALR